MNRININGVDIVGGRNVTIRGDKIVIDGVVQDGIELRKITEIRVIEGSIENLRTDLNVTCGEVTGKVDAGMNVDCGNVGGNVDAGMSVNCENVNGNVDAGMDVRCGDVKGSVDAGMDVRKN